MKLISNLSFDNAIKQYEEKYNREYYHEQLIELRRGFEEGLDIRAYADPNFEHEQMEVIREGLEKGLNVSKYVFPYLASPVMRQKRERLEHEQVLNN